MWWERQIRGRTSQNMQTGWVEEVPLQILPIHPSELEARIFWGVEVLKKVFKIMLETWFSSSFRKTWLWMGWEIWVYFIFSFYFFFLPENIQILFLMKMVKIKYKDPVPLLTASSLFCYYSMTAFSSLNIFFLRGPHY